MKTYAYICLNEEVSDTEAELEIFSNDQTLIDYIYNLYRDTDKSNLELEEGGFDDSCRLKIKYRQSQDKDYRLHARQDNLYYINWLCSLDWEPFAAENNKIHFRNGLPSPT